ncbi:MAG: hypothetical protein QXL78_02390 [Methanocellales archaeon]
MKRLIFPVGSAVSAIAGIKGKMQGDRKLKKPEAKAAMGSTSNISSF